MQEVKQEKSPIKQRILFFLKEKGISMYDCYAKTGITRGILAQNNGISEDNITRFLAYYIEVNTDWLILGRGSMLRTEQTQPVPQPALEPIIHQDSSPGEAAVYYKMYKEEKEGKEALIAENATLKERLRQWETPPVKEPTHPPLIEKVVDAFTPDSLGGSGKDFIHARNPTTTKKSSASKT